MKSSHILLAVAFAILAIVGIACDDVRSIEPQISTGAATNIGPQQTPDPDLPVILRAAATAPASAQTTLDFKPQQDVHHALEISMRTYKTAVERYHDVTTPQSIPLLI